MKVVKSMTVMTKVIIIKTKKVILLGTAGTVRETMIKPENPVLKI